jgi:hypothetical protein
MIDYSSIIIVLPVSLRLIHTDRRYSVHGFYVRTCGPSVFLVDDWHRAVPERIDTNRPKSA